MTTAPAVTWPNVERVLLDWLRPQLPGTRLLTELPANLEEQLPVVQVVRVGGGRDFSYRLDLARVDIDCYAATRPAAAALAGQVRTLVATLPNVQTGGALVVRVIEETGPSWRPETNPHLRRFGMTLRVMLRPA